MTAGLMLATERYPAGTHVLPWLGRNKRPVEMVCVDELFGTEARAIYSPPRDVQFHARHAATLGEPEAFDGVIVCGRLKRILLEEHGGRNPLGWVRSEKLFSTEVGALPVVWVFAGDHVVAVVGACIGTVVGGGREHLAFSGAPLPDAWRTPEAYRAARART